MRRGMQACLLAASLAVMGAVPSAVAAQSDNRLGFRFGYPSVETEELAGWVMGLSIDRDLNSFLGLRGIIDGWLSNGGDEMALETMSTGLLGLVMLGDPEFRIVGGGGSMWIRSGFAENQMIVDAYAWVWEGTLEMRVGGGTTLAAGMRFGDPVDQLFITFAMDI